MYRTMLKSKIHRATITAANIDYNGSITVDRDLLTAADIYEHEQVQVVNISNGARLATYAIAGASGSGEVVLNGAAAKLMSKGDIVIILSYGLVEEKLAKDYKSTIVMVDGNNRIASVSKNQTTADIY